MAAANSAEAARSLRAQSTKKGSKPFRTNSDHSRSHGFRLWSHRRHSTWRDAEVPLLRPQVREASELQHVTLVIALYDYDFLSEDDVSGFVLIPLTRPPSRFRETRLSEGAANMTEMSEGGVGAQRRSRRWSGASRASRTSRASHGDGDSDGPYSEEYSFKVDSPIVYGNATNGCGRLTCTVTVSLGAAVNGALIRANRDHAGLKATTLSKRSWVQPGHACCALM